jgi:hypothetical protein
VLQRLAKTAALSLATLAFFVGGCGGDDDPLAPPAESTEVDLPTGGEVETVSGHRMKPVKAKETLKEGVDRIAKTAKSGDCKEVVALFPLARESTDAAADCEFLRQALNREFVSSQEFGGGGVIDLVTDDVGSTAVLILDADGRFHVAFVDGYLGGESAGTEPPTEEWDNAAQAALDALAQKDCEAFIAVAHHRFGPGSAPEEADTCAFVEANSVPTILEENPKAKLKSLGANADYAFYGLETPNTNLTMVLARQVDPKVLPEGLEPLPPDSPDLAFAAIYPTYIAQEKD